MKRARRIFVNTLAATSALLCAAIGALWIRSDLNRDRISCVYQSREMIASCYIAEFISDHGRLRYRWKLRGDALTDGPLFRIHRSVEDASESTSDGSFLRTLGFRYSYLPDDISGDLDFSERLDLGCPHWAMAMFFACVPFLWLRQHLREREANRKTTLCATCGYDLRATPDICPECGMPAKAERRIAN